MGEIAIAVDCSGSIGPEELNQFAAEVRTIKDEQNPSVIHVMYFDTRIAHYERFEREDDLHMEPHGGGGTAFSPVFEYMHKHDINPLATVFLTDLYCNDFGRDPGHPVLWVSHGAEEAPFGEVVTVN